MQWRLVFRDAPESSSRTLSDLGSSLLYTIDLPMRDSSCPPNEARLQKKSLRLPRKWQDPLQRSDTLMVLQWDGQTTHSSVLESSLACKRVSLYLPPFLVCGMCEI